MVKYFTGGGGSDTPYNAAAGGGIIERYYLEIPFEFSFEDETIFQYTFTKEA